MLFWNGLFVPSTRIPSVNACLLKAGLCSFCLHALVLWLADAGTATEYGFIPGHTGITLTANIAIAERAPARMEPATVRKDGVDAAHAPREIAPTSQTPAAEATKEAPEIPAYLVPGRLTRQPVLLTEVDLNEDGIDDVAVSGQVELSIFIDSTGLVADVLYLPGNEELLLFAERVAERFRRARFLPGELDGKAVKSQLRVVVVSEPRANEGRPPGTPARP